MKPKDYQLLRELYHELADVPSEQVSAELDRRNLAPELRVELEAMLDHQANPLVLEPQRFEAALRDVVKSLDDCDEPGWAGSRAPLPNRIASFQIEEIIGHGGMGVVYRGVQDSPRREVAVKVVHALGATPEVLRRFEFEADILARLDHPNVAKIIESGIDQESTGLPYLVMELIRGRNLLEYCQDKSMGVTDRVNLFRKICDGVEHAHQLGIVHRDLKPANILVTDDGQPKILDFGIARPISDPEVSTPGRTKSGNILGTLAWMSPEQASGKVHALDTRSDVYALGVIFFRLLSGQMPQDVSELTPWEAAKRISEEPIPRLGQFDRSLRGDLESIAAKALEKNPKDRYPSAGAFEGDLRRYASFQPVEARPWSASYQLRQFTRRHRVLVGLSLLTLIAVLIALVTVTFFWREAEDAKALADSRFRSLLDLALVDTINDLRERADRDLWPATLERTDAMREWIEEAEAVLKNQPRIEEQLELLRTERASKASLGNTGVDDEEFTLAQMQWRFDQLSQLNAEMRAFRGEPNEDGKGASYGSSLSHVQQRIVRAERIAAHFENPEVEELWDLVMYDLEGVPGIEPSKLPKRSLIPLDVNPVTGHWWFWHPASGKRPPEDLDADEDSPFPYRIDGESGMVFVFVPGGTTFMGAQSQFPNKQHYDPRAKGIEGPVLTVELDPFFISAFEMTQGQWERFTGDNPSGYRAGIRNGNWHFNWNHPIETISWLDATETLKRLELVLPTEAQWEHAGRGGSDQRWWCGDTRDSLADIDNLADQHGKREGAPALFGYESWDDGIAVHGPVGKKAPNPYGLFDVHGNVHEFTRDMISVYRQQDVQPGDGARREFVDKRPAIRGGSWATLAAEARCTSRIGNLRHEANDRLGVRPVLPLPKN